VSLQIRRLEDRIGARLFERGSRPVSLTPTGQILLEYARRITALHDEAVARLTSPDVRSFVRLGILEELATHRLPTVLQAFATVFPRAKLQVQVKLGNELLGEMMQGRLDLVVATGEDGQSRALPLWREPLAWVGAQHIGPSSLRPVPLVLLPDPCFYRRAAVRALSEVTMGWDPVCTSSTMTGVRAAVLAGIGITVMGRSEVTDGLRVLGTEHGLPRLPETEILLYHATDRYHRMAQPLAQHIRKVV
jgi:DNA-binding transcriptional LysR family regulator